MKKEKKIHFDLKTLIYKLKMVFMKKERKKKEYVPDENRFPSELKETKKKHNGFKYKRSCR